MREELVWNSLLSHTVTQNCHQRESLVLTSFQDVGSFLRKMNEIIWKRDSKV